MEVAPEEVQPLRSPVSKPWLTTSVTEAEWLRLPLVPVMVIGNDPIVAVVVVVTVSVDMPPPLTDAGLNEPDAPEPKPEALKLTVPVKPFVAVTVTVYVVLPPCAIVRLAGVAEMVKSGVGGAASATSSKSAYVGSDG